MPHLLQSSLLCLKHLFSCTSSDYARWLKLPIMELKQHQPLFNMDGTEIKVEHYLGDHKAIFRYPWFSAFQPRVNWKRGWIYMAQLPIILLAPNAAKATYVPRIRNIPCPIKKSTDQYFLGWVTIGSTTTDKPNEVVPEEYRRHSKVFSKAESQRLPQSTIWDHAIELLPGALNTLLGRLLPLIQEEKNEMHKFVQGHLKRGTICMLH